MLTRSTSLVLTFAVGCGGQGGTNPQPPKPDSLQGLGDASAVRSKAVPTNETRIVARDANGRALTRVPIAFKSPDQVMPSIGATDDHGHFVLPASSVELTATVLTPDAFGIAPIHADGADTVSLVLDARCSRFEGMVEDQSASTGTQAVDFVHIFRYGDPSSIAFSTRVDERGTFNGCLPEGRYFVDTELDEVGGGVLFDIPTAEPIAYIATRDSVAKTDPPTRIVPSISVTEVVRDLPRDVGIIALGESTHGTGEFALERARFTIELAQSRKVRFILLEASFGETLALDRYVRDGKGDVRTAVTALRFWMWDTEEFIKSVELIRAFNKKRPAKDRIGFRGTDVQMTAGAVTLLLGDEAKSLSAEDRAAVAKVPDNDVSKWNALPDSEKQQIRSVVSRLATPRHPDDVRALAAAAILTRLDLIPVSSGPELYHMQVRDRLMAEMTLRITEDGKHLSVVWAHMGHVTKKWMFGQETMGGHLQSRLGSRYVALAMLGVSGSTRAWDPQTKVGVIPHVLDDAPSYSVESALSTEAFAPQYVLFSRLSPELRDWLSKLRYIRFIGSVFPQSDGGWRLFDMMRGFDGAVIFRSTSSTTPTPTGVRKAKAN